MAKKPRPSAMPACLHLRNIASEADRVPDCCDGLMGYVARPLRASLQDAIDFGRITGDRRVTASRRLKGREKELRELFLVCPISDAALPPALVDGTELAGGR